MQRTFIRLLAAVGLAPLSALTAARNEAAASNIELQAVTAERDRLLDDYHQLRQACTSVAVWSIETHSVDGGAPSDHAIMVPPWKSEYYGVDEQPLRFGVLRHIGRLVFKDWDLRHLGVPPHAPAYQDFFREHPEEVATWKELPRFDRRGDNRLIA